MMGFWWKNSLMKGLHNYYHNANFFFPTSCLHREDIYSSFPWNVLPYSSNVLGIWRNFSKKEHFSSSHSNHSSFYRRVSYRLIHPLSLWPWSEDLPHTQFHASWLLVHWSSPSDNWQFAWYCGCLPSGCWSVYSGISFTSWCWWFLPPGCYLFIFIATVSWWWYAIFSFTVHGLWWFFWFHLFALKVFQSVFLPVCFSIFPVHSAVFIFPSYWTPSASCSLLSSQPCCLAFLFSFPSSWVPEWRWFWFVFLVRGWLWDCLSILFWATGGAIRSLSFRGVFFNF